MFVRKRPKINEKEVGDGPFLNKENQFETNVYIGRIEALCNQINSQAITGRKSNIQTGAYSIKLSQTSKGDQSNGVLLLRIYLSVRVRFSDRQANKAKMCYRYSLTEVDQQSIFYKQTERIAPVEYLFAQCDQMGKLFSLYLPIY